MKRDYFISVAMATYNGEKYIKEQIDSILNNLSEEDELVISDDGSVDKTLEIIQSYQDNRIKLMNGPKKGVKQNFANALSKCRGKYIFLSDQDDIWEKNKVKKVLEVFENSDCSLVIHDCTVIDNQYKVLHDSFFKIRNSKKGIIKNIWKNSYIGCCMCFEKNLIDSVLPIPNRIEMHDQWIGILAEKKGNGSIFIFDKLIQYRRHENNVSKMKHHSIFVMLKNRWNFILQIMKR